MGLLFGAMLLPQTPALIQLSPQAGSRAAGLEGPEGSRRGQVSGKSRREGCGRLPARRKFWTSMLLLIIITKL